MDRVTDITDIVRREVADYSGAALKARTFYFENTEQQAYTVLIVPDYEYPRQSYSNVMVLAHIEDDYVVIDEDTTDRPLWEELVRAGIPRERIICLYAGEVIPVSDS